MRNTLALLTAVLFISKENLSLIWEIIHTVSYAFFSVVIVCLPFLDAEKPILQKIATTIVIQIICGLGVGVSPKEKKVIGVLVFIIVDLILTIPLFVAEKGT